MADDDEGRGGKSCEPLARGDSVTGKINEQYLVDKNTRLIVQGIHRHGRHVPRAAGQRSYGTKVVGGVTPGKGGTTHRRLAGLQHRRRSREEDRRERDGDFRAAAVCRRRHHGSRRRRRLPLIVCITEGIPVDMVQAWEFLKTGKIAADRAELPGHHLAGQMQDRHHAGPHS